MCVRIHVSVYVWLRVCVVVPTKRQELKRGKDQGKTWVEKREQGRAEEDRREVTGEIRENGGNNKQGREEKGVQERTGTQETM